MSDYFVREIRGEEQVRNLFGRRWRKMNSPDVDGAWGIAIVQAILDGSKPFLRDISLHLGVKESDIEKAYLRLSLNGILKEGLIESDRPSLERLDKIAWGYYAGYASGHVGLVGSNL